MQAGNASCSYLYYTIVFQLSQDFVILYLKKKKHRWRGAASITDSPGCRIPLRSMQDTFSSKRIALDIADILGGFGLV